MGDEVAHIVQHAVGPQVAGHIIEDQPVDLPGGVGGVILHIGS